MGPPKRGATASLVADMALRLMSPYQLNPFNLNPLEGILSAEVDFEALRANPPVRLLIAATSVSNGRLQIFRETELTRDMVLASGCLPMLSHAVQINGERYWDECLRGQSALDRAGRSVRGIRHADRPDHADGGPGVAGLLARHCEAPRADHLQRCVLARGCCVDHDGAGGRVREPGPGVFT